MKFLITGGAGFIGSSLIRHLINNTDHCVVNIDILTYAGNLSSLTSIEHSTRYAFEKADICDRLEIQRIIYEHQPDIIMHLAAESHVDRSINGPAKFIQTNIVGTFHLLEIAREYWQTLSGDKKNRFRLHHISTDEVYGDLGDTDLLFTEKSPYDPSSPYSASKASSDHLVRAWQRTFDLPTLITNCSNNYGPYQHPEKLIPMTIFKALEGKNIPVYGNGKQRRDWLYVDDHASALARVALNGLSGETYNIGGHNVIENIEVVKTICNILDEVAPVKSSKFNSYGELIEFVEDRPGHDIKYAIDAKKIFQKLNWAPIETFETGIRKTIGWYLDNKDWCHEVNDKVNGLRLSGDLK